MVENSVIYTLSQSTNTVFVGVFLKEKKCPSCTAAGSLALHTRGFFTPEQFRWLSLGRHENPENSQKGVEMGPTNSIISSLDLVGGSSGPVYHANSCPRPAESLKAFLGLESKPLRIPRFAGLSYLKAGAIPF